MNTKFDFRQSGEKIVYVKSVQVADLPEDVQAQAGGLTQLYAVHRSNGEQIALVANRKLAYVLAREHEFTPVTVH